MRLFQLAYFFFFFANLKTVRETHKEWGWSLRKKPDALMWEEEADLYFEQAEELFLLGARVFF